MCSQTCSIGGYFHYYSERSFKFILVVLRLLVWLLCGTHAYPRAILTIINNADTNILGINISLIIDLNILNNIASVNIVSSIFTSTSPASSSS